MSPSLNFVIETAFYAR